MIKWSIQRTPQNYLEVNQILSEIYHKQYTGGAKIYEDRKQFMHYPPVKRRVVLNYARYDYKQITLEELRKLMKTKTIDLNNWHIKITPENREKIIEWWDEEKNGVRDFDIGAGYGIRNGRKDSFSDYFIPKTWNEITYDEFRFHILQEYTRQDWLDGRIAIQRPESEPDSLLDSFVKECNARNARVLPVAGFLISNGFGYWSHIFTKDLGGRPVIKDVKEIYKNEVMNEKKVIGYNVKPDFRSAIASITGMVLGNSSSYCDFVNSDTSKTYRELLKLQVLDIWCEPVYEKPKPELPTLYGYEGVDMGDFLKFGCAELSKSWFTSSNSRTIIEMKLDSGKTLTSSHIADIRKYLENV